MDLFDYMRTNTMKSEAPLASRMRPETLEEIVGQQHIIGKDKLLYRAIRADKLGSVIFYGPPGTGKTTIAKVIAHTTKAEFTQINATVAGKKDMEDVVRQAKDNLGMYGKHTILFVDEIHRFNKSQQDYLLPFVEDGTLILIGATTENPYFEVNGALLSRSIVFELKALEPADIKQLLKRALTDMEKGMGAYQAVADEDALDFLADIAGGDARNALNALELGILTTEKSEDGKIHITLEVAQECIQKRAVRYDKDGDNHYDTISAFIKSMRGSDPDAAVYYLARMLYAGEDIKFIAHDLRGRGCGKRGSAGTYRGRQRGTGGGAHWYAGGPDHSFPGGPLCGNSTEIQFRVQCRVRGNGCREKSAFHAGSGASAGLPLWWLRKTGTRNRIQIRSQLSESLRKTAVSAGWNGRTGILPSVRKRL